MSDAVPGQAEALDLDVDASSVAVARRFVARAFAGRVPRDVIADLVLATSELVTNAIEHGERGDHPVRVTAHVDGSSAGITVRSNGSAELGSPDGWSLPAPDVRTGRGLGIVRQITDHVEIARVHGGIETSARRSW